MIIGITGGTGCGKTTALEAIRALGGTVIDCDAVYHRLLQTDKAMLAAIDRRFPGTVTDGRLDRKKLGPLVFSDPRALEDLNAITHAAVKAAVLALLAEAPPLAAIDAIALFESGLAELCHMTVAVTAPEADRIRRLMARDSITREQALQRIRAQKPESYFRQHCDHVLENAGTEESFNKMCIAFFRHCIV